MMIKVRTLNAYQLSEINRNLTLALMGATGKARKHIEKVLEILNGLNNKK